MVFGINTEDFPIVTSLCLKTTTLFPVTEPGFIRFAEFVSLLSSSNDICNLFSTDICAIIDVIYNNNNNNDNDNDNDNKNNNDNDKIL